MLSQRAVHALPSPLATPCSPCPMACELACWGGSLVTFSGLVDESAPRDREWVLGPLCREAPVAARARRQSSSPPLLSALSHNYVASRRLPSLRPVLVSVSLPPHPHYIVVHKTTENPAWGLYSRQQPAEQGSICVERCGQAGGPLTEASTGE